MSYDPKCSMLVFVVLLSCVCGCRESSEIPPQVQPSLSPPSTASETEPKQLTVKRNTQSEPILFDLGFSAWAFEVKGAAWSWEVVVSHQARNSNRAFQPVFRKDGKEASSSFYARNPTNGSGDGAFGSLVVLLPEPSSLDQVLTEELVIVTKLGHDPTAGKGVGRRSISNTLRTPMKEVYPFDVGRYTQRSHSVRGSSNFAKITAGETMTLVDEVFDFTTDDDSSPHDQREAVRIEIKISALESSIDSSEDERRQAHDSVLVEDE